MDLSAAAFDYHKAIGMLLYLAHSSRPDILYATTYLSHFVNAFDTTHVTAVKRILWYLVSMCNLTICYNKQLIDPRDSSTLVPVGYADANWGNSDADKRSVLGVVFLFAGGPISWTAKTQRCVTLSSTEAEINAISKGAHEALFLHQLTPTFVSKLERPVVLYNNNQSALTIVAAPNGTYHCRMKHYTIKLGHLRECLSHGDLHVDYCPTNNMPADLLTKALSRVKIAHLVGRLHMRNPPSLE